MSYNIYNATTDSLEKVSGRVANGILNTLDEVKESASDNVASGSLAVKELAENIEGELIYTFDSTIAAGTYETNKDLTQYKYIYFCLDWNETATYRRYTQSAWYRVSEIPKGTSGSNAQLTFIPICAINSAKNWYGVEITLFIENNTKMYIGEVGKFSVTSINSVKVFGIK